MDERANELIDRICDAALHPEQWQAVVEGLSAIFGGSPVNLGILISEVDGLQPRYVVGLPLEGMVQFLEYLVEQPSWSMNILRRYADRFGDLSEDFGHVDLSSTSLYTEWMKPRGLAPLWPAGHMLLGESKQSLGGFFIFRRDGEGPFTRTEFEEADHLVPHLRRTARILARIGCARRESLAFSQILDRLPTGVLLLDSRRRVVAVNQTAQSILDLADGFSIDRNGPSAADAQDNATLHKLIADALEPAANREPASRAFATASRPSRKREFALMVSPLRTPVEGRAPSDAVVAIFVVDPERSSPPVPNVLKDLYSLTHSEAAIVHLMSTGLSLEDAAKSRGISINTARSHLKHAFSKTGTRRQGELVRLIVSGVGTIRSS